MNIQHERLKQSYYVPVIHLFVDFRVSVCEIVILRPRSEVTKGHTHRRWTRNYLQALTDVAGI